MQRQKIKPVVDVPIVLCLETVTGREATSQFTGTEYWYNVVHDSQPSIIYLPDAGRQAIENLRPEPGDYVELLKQKRGKEFVFAAQLVSDSKEPPPAPPRQMRTLAPRNGVSTNVAAPVPVPVPAPAPVPVRQYAGQAQPPNPEAPIPAHAQQLAGCLRVSLDAWEQVRAYAQANYGVDLEYTSEDVRAVGLSFYITKTRDGGR